MLLYNMPSPLLLVSFLISAILLATDAANYHNTGFCNNKADGKHRNKYDCRTYYLCQDGGSQRKDCPEGQAFSKVSKTCANVKCEEELMLDRAGMFEDPNFCLSQSDGFHKNPLDCNKFYRCVNRFTYSFACGATLYYNPESMTCDWARNVQCTITSGQVTTARPWTTRPVTFNPWTTRRPWVTGTTFRPWVTNTRPWTQPPTFVPWTTRRPTFNPVTFRPFTTRNPFVTQTFRPVTNNGFGGCNRVVCYFVNWAQYRDGNAKQMPDDLDANLCSHIIFSFAKLEGNRIAPFEYNDESQNYPRIIRLKQVNPNLKVLLALGGWNMGSLPFSNMVNTPQNRQEFITTTIAFLRQRQFDGIDLDWEYPANRGSPAMDKERHAMLLTEMRTAFDQEARTTGRQTLLLTAAVAAGQATIDSAYNIPILNRALDFINLMSYDLHGSWESTTGHHSPLYRGGSDFGTAASLNVDSAARYWIQRGASPNKLVLGLPLYGRSFRLSNPGNSGVGAPASGAGTAGTYTKEAGFLSYYEICQKIRNGAQVTRTNDQMVPYMVSGSDWVGYDDAQSLGEKVRYAKQMNLGGVMIWDLSMDDFRGAFCNQGPWPLLNSVVNQCRAF